MTGEVAGVLVAIYFVEVSAWSVLGVDSGAGVTVDGGALTVVMPPPVGVVSCPVVGVVGVAIASSNFLLASSKKCCCCGVTVSEVGTISGEAPVDTPGTLSVGSVVGKPR